MIKTMLTLLAAFAFQQVNAESYGVIDQNGDRADQSGLLAGLYTVKAQFFTNMNESMTANKEMAHQFLVMESDMRPYCGHNWTRGDWTRSYWDRTDAYATQCEAYETHTYASLQGLDLSIQQLKAQETPQCAYITQDLIDVRNNMSYAWQARVDDTHMMLDDMYDYAYEVDSANGNFYVRSEWVDGVHSCYQRAHVRQQNYYATYGSLESDLDAVINEIRSCYHLN